MKKLTAKQRNIMMATIMFIASSLLYAISVTVFINCSDNMILPAGVSGIAMLIARIINNINPLFAEGIYYSIIYVLFNIPLFLLAYRSIGKIFSIITLGNVVLTAGLTAILTQVLQNNFADFEKYIVNISSMDYITITLLAGILTGASVGFALSANFSTGGTDIVSLYFGIKKGVSIGKYILLLNIAVTAANGIYNIILKNNLNAIFYTTLYICISSMVVDLIFTRTKKVLLEIISDKGDDVAHYILTETNHGCTIIDAVGAFSSAEKKVLHVVVSVRQIKEIIYKIKLIDPNSFSIQLPVDLIHGKFYIPPFK